MTEGSLVGARAAAVAAALVLWGAAPAVAQEGGTALGFMQSGASDPGFAPAQPATLTFAAPKPAHRPQASADPAPQFVSPLKPEGGTQWSFFSGIGFNQEINNSAQDIQIATGGIRWTHMWGASFGGIMRGHPSLAIEFLPVMAFLESGRTTWGVGANLIYEHHFALEGRVLPVFKLGAGFLYTNHTIPVEETQHNFSLLTAFGVDIMVTDRGALFLGYRFHHVSNANTGNVNPGINVHSYVFGLSLYR